MRRCWIGSAWRALRTGQRAQGRRHARQPWAALVGTVVVALAADAVAPSPALARAREDGAPAQAMGTADAVTSSATGSSALFSNPAGMSRLQQYVLTTGYAFSNALSGHAVTVGAVDSATNGVVAMGGTYTYLTSKVGGLRRKGHDVRFGLSSGFRGQDFSLFVGVAGRYDAIVVGRADTAGNAEHNDPKFFTLDAGLILQVGQMFRLGFAAQNLLDTKAVAEAPRRLRVGAGLQLDAFELTFDTDIDLQSQPAGGGKGPVLSYAAGAQYLIAQIVVARAGFRYDGLDQNKRLTLGAGYVSRTFGVDVGFAQSLDEGADTAFTLGVNVFLP